jgi:hypothetical protein
MQVVQVPSGILLPLRGAECPDGPDGILVDIRQGLQITHGSHQILVIERWIGFQCAAVSADAVGQMLRPLLQLLIE